jgi:hypothetical protein
MVMLAIEPPLIIDVILFNDRPHDNRQGLAKNQPFRKRQPRHLGMDLHVLRFSASAILARLLRRQLFQEPIYRGARKGARELVE